MRVALVGFSEGRVRILSRTAAELGVELLVFEDPDVCRKKRVIERAAHYPMITEVIAARYVESTELLTAIAAAHARAPFDAVYPGLEYTVLAAAEAAERLSLPGAGIDAARILRDKLLLRARADAHGIANPRWAEMHGPDDVAAFAAGCAELVLKPANRQASLGVQILAPDDDLPGAWAETVGADEDSLVPDERPAWRFMAEDRVVGPEFSVELLIDRGRVVFANTTGKAVQPGRYPVELGHTVPAPVGESTRTNLVEATEALAKAIGFGTGVMHAEWIVAGDRPVLVECAGRLPGDSIVELIDHAYGTNLSLALLRLLAGETVSFPEQAGQAAAIRFLAAEPGVVRAVHGVAAAESAAGVVECTVTVAVGDRINSARNSWERIGHVLAVGATAAEAMTRANEATRCLRIQTS